MNLKFRDEVNKGDLGELKKWLANQKKEPSKDDFLSCAAGAEQSDVRAFLVDKVVQRKLSRSKWNEAAAAAISGSMEHLALAIKRDVDFEAVSPLGRPLLIAASQNHPEMVKAFLDRGVEAAPTEKYTTPLAVAIRRGHSEVVEMLVAGGGGSQAALAAAVSVGNGELVRRLVMKGCELDNPSVRAMRSATIVPVMVDVGWNPKKPLPDKDPTTNPPSPLWDHWSTTSPGDEKLDKLEFLTALAEAGVTCNAQGLVDTFSRIRSDQVDVLNALLEMGPKLGAKVRWTGSGRKLITECAMEDLPLAFLKALVDRGAPLPNKLRVQSSWEESEEKRAWLSSLGDDDSEMTLSEFLRLEEATADELRAQLAKSEGVFGLAIGMKSAALKSLGLKKSDWDRGLSVAKSRGTVTAITCDIDADEGDEHFQVLAKFIEERFGVAGKTELFESEGNTGEDLDEEVEIEARCHWRTAELEIELIRCWYDGPGFIRSTLTLNSIDA